MQVSSQNSGPNEKPNEREREEREERGGGGGATAAQRQSVCTILQQFGGLPTSELLQLRQMPVAMDLAREWPCREGAHRRRELGGQVLCFVEARSGGVSSLSGGRSSSVDHRHTVGPCRMTKRGHWAHPHSPYGDTQQCRGSRPPGPGRPVLGRNEMPAACAPYDGMRLGAFISVIAVLLSLAVKQNATSVEAEASRRTFYYRAISEC